MGVLSLDCVRKRFSGFYRFKRCSGDAPKSLDSRFPILNFPNITHLTANDKDFSLALEMTIRESDVS